MISAPDVGRLELDRLVSRKVLRHSSTVDRVAKPPGTHVRRLAWTAAGASAGGLLRYWVHHIWPGRALAATLVITAVAAVLIGFAVVAPIRASVKTVLVSAGGAAASISAVATQAVSVTPTQSIFGLAGYLVCVLAGVLLGMLMAFSVSRNVERAERN